MDIPWKPVFSQHVAPAAQHNFQKYTNNSRLKTSQKHSVQQFILLYTSTCSPLNFSQTDTKQTNEKAMTDQK